MHHVSLVGIPTLSYITYLLNFGVVDKYSKKIIVAMGGPYAVNL